MHFIPSMSNALRITLRRIFRRTPPQTESGWTRLSVALPPETEQRQRLVEMYDGEDDSITQVYVWSMPSIHPKDRKSRYWREIAPEHRRGRGLGYYERSQTVFG